MDSSFITKVLEKYKNGSLSMEEALEELRFLPYEDLGFAKIDHHRSLRNGFPEVIFGSGKTSGQIAAIINHMLAKECNILVTRLDETTYQSLPDSWEGMEYHPQACTLLIRRTNIPVAEGFILVVSAGTADIGVAEEAALTAEMMGNRVERLYDVGVAGIHRLMDHQHKLDQAAVIIVAAGMEGALPSIIGGMVDKPVLAVPTSIGYGASFGGISALLAMLNTCASGVAVFNIDNGFGAGYFASMINRQMHQIAGKYKKEERADQ